MQSIPETRRHFPDIQYEDNITVSLSLPCHVYAAAASAALTLSPTLLFKQLLQQQRGKNHSKR